MITKAEIQTIDYNGNTCTVRIPIFESAGITETVCLPATFAYTPGIYNSYIVGDVVYIGFENNKLSSPIVLGKLYLGAGTESKTARGTLNCIDAVMTNTAKIPLTTEIIADKETSTVAVDKNSCTYTSVDQIVSKLSNTLTKTEDPTTETFSNIFCTGPCSNLYGTGPVNHGYSSEPAVFGYIIKLYDRDNLTPSEMVDYMYYMTGLRTMPIDETTDVYKGAFYFTNGEIYYPMRENSTLKLVRVCESIEERVKHIIDDNGVTITDITGTEPVTKLFTSTHTVDIDSNKERTDRSYNVINIDKTEEETE